MNVRKKILETRVLEADRKGTSTFPAKKSVGGPQAEREVVSRYVDFIRKLQLGSPLNDSKVRINFRTWEQIKMSPWVKLVHC